VFFFRTNVYKFDIKKQYFGVIIFAFGHFKIALLFLKFSVRVSSNSITPSPLLSSNHSAPNRHPHPQPYYPNHTATITSAIVHPVVSSTLGIGNPSHAFGCFHAQAILQRSLY
jgi:hypothetical protein